MLLNALKKARCSSLIAVVLAMTIISCTDDDTVNKSPRSAAENNEQATLDSIFLYAKEIYFWNEALPEYDEFAPRNYSSSSGEELKNLESALFDITQYPINPETGYPYEYLGPGITSPKYSYIEENSSSSSQLGYLAANKLEGEEEGYGFALTAVGAEDIRMRYVTKGSPAYKKGIRRGDRLLAINGRNLSIKSQADIDFINGAFNTDSFTATITNADNETDDFNLSSSSFEISPIFKDTVIEATNTKIGYLAYYTFSSLTNSQEGLEAAFKKFASANVKDLIIDLRYNGGGYVTTATLLTNLIAPSRLNGKVMFVEHFNETMKNGQATILKNKIYKDGNGNKIPYNGRDLTYYDLDYSAAGNTTRFEKEGTLETVENVYFITTNGTASSSELVINSLKPYMNVTLIGTTSYGKPVGFFGIDIDKYTMYISNFRTLNSKGEGDYFQGFEPDFKSDDDVTHDFGDPKEQSISVAIDLATGNVPGFGRTSRESSFKPINIGKTPQFNGMIEKRINIKK
ncbi:S41 family peptidase [Fulvivirga sediminis]|uniref:PDZ domain-containing protein n=1 Tax=Fulvivirga sediminis TaxID=2803949 RepID=A0A937K0K1_9BACT|nr:S41 family peptidase [Fulvivirga sediminis]MBL3656380.1 PDZ domain-containing protein [Fulvivirga sediminis]